MKRFKILILTDSLGFPRLDPETVRYDQTWVARLKTAYPDIDIIHHGRGGATLPELRVHSEYYVATTDPDLVIMQSGIVDCAPRALRPVERMIVSRLPRFFQQAIRRNSNYLRRWRNIQYCPPGRFRDHVEELERAFRNVLWLEIVPASEEWEVRVPGISQAIADHNAILSTRDHISLANLTKKDIMSDHHHMTVSGHAHVINCLLAHPAMAYFTTKVQF